MKRIALLTLATAVCFAGCTGEDSNKQVINPYELGKDKELVQGSDKPEKSSPKQAEQDEMPAPAEPGQLVNDPDGRSPKGNGPRENELAGNSSASQPIDNERSIDPRLLEEADSRNSRYQSTRPDRLGGVRTAAGEQPIENTDPLNRPFPAAPAAEQIDPPTPAVETDQLADENSTGNSPGIEELPTEQPASEAPPEAAEPAVEDLALEQPGAIEIPENFPAIADSAPSLEVPAINSVNKPLLGEGSSEPATDTEAAAPPAEPQTNRPRPSDQLLERMESGRATDNTVNPNAVRPPREPLEPQGLEGPITADDPATQPEATSEPMPEAPEQPATPADEASQLRTWVDSTGRLKFKAQFIRFEDGKVYLKAKDDSQLIIPRQRFSQKDQQFLKQIERGDFGI